VSGRALGPADGEFLAAHRWAMLTTLRRDGRAQTSMLAYHWDGTDLVLSTRSSSAKWANIGRRSDVVVSVQGDGGPEDHRFLAIDGDAERIEHDPERHDLTVRLLGSLLPADRASLQADLDAGLDARRRVIVRIRPRSATGRV
jgi:PPOX class probable F420-dependent enzyme